MIPQKFGLESCPIPLTLQSSGAGSQDGSSFTCRLAHSEEVKCPKPTQESEFQGWVIFLSYVPRGLLPSLLPFLSTEGQFECVFMFL